MKNISKQLEELVTKFNKNNFLKARIILTFYYTATVMLVLFFFSLSVYLIFEHNDTIVSNNVKNIVLNLEGENNLLSEQNYHHEEAEFLLETMFLINFIISIFVIVFSYWFSKKTLLPIEVSNQKQRKFISDVSHELRTPLSVMKAGSEVFVMRKHNQKEYEMFISNQLREINYLIEMSNNLLFLLKINQNSNKNTIKFDLSLMLETESKNIIPYASTKNISIKIEITKNIWFRGDKIEIKRVILNLLKNAIDYNKKHGSVSLSLFKKNKKIFLKISDTGIGIKKENQNLIFSRFYKVDSSRNSSEDGSGLGLSMVKDIVKKYNGNIKVESSLNKGTTFIIIFPLQN